LSGVLPHAVLQGRPPILSNIFQTLIRQWRLYKTAHLLEKLDTIIFAREAEHRAKNMLANVQAIVHPIPATLALGPNPNFSLPLHGHVATTEFEKQISWG
jgi:hypothetical protein